LAVSMAVLLVGLAPEWVVLWAGARADASVGLWDIFSLSMAWMSVAWWVAEWAVLLADAWAVA
jgi:hypothetical protein